MKLKNILLEGLALWKIDVLVKTDAKINKVEVFNQIRALPGVVVLTVEQSDFLDSKATPNYEYALLHIKFLARNEPGDEINKIKMSGVKGDHKIYGLLQMVPRLATLKPMGKY